MSFISAEFFIFLVITFLTYFLVPKKIQWIVLLVASYVFYLFSNAVVFVLLLASTTITFFGGILIDRVNQKFALAANSTIEELSKEDKLLIRGKKNKQKQLILIIGLLLIFCILAFMKYYNFFAINVNSLLGLITTDTKIPVLNLLLPLGISFYTFQSAGYIIDVYRGKIEPDRNLAKFALFVSFFPQIVQGPISRYDELAHQLYDSHNFDYTRAKFGLQLVLWGLFKKLVIADRAAILVNTVFDNHAEYEGLTLLIGAMFYCVQIYGDFSGGIDIARGVSQVIGIELPQNFMRPFFATSISDFWRRWHISLSSWMRDYIFYPLSLSKGFARLGKKTRKILGNYLGKMFPTVLAMLITFFVVGIWHGANWKYIAYGLYNGFFIVLGILIGPLFESVAAKRLWQIKSFGWRFFQVILTFFLVTIGRFFSRGSSLTDAWQMIKSTFSTFNPWVLFDGTFLKLGLDQKNFQLLLIVICILVIVDLFQESGVKIRQSISEQNLAFRWLIYLVAIFSVLIFGVYGLEYDAASFIYRGF